MPIERHAFYFYNVASTSQQQQVQPTATACSCRLHVPISSVASSSSKNLGKSPMVTWKLAAPSIKSSEGQQQYELAYPVPPVAAEPDVLEKGGSPEPSWSASNSTPATPSSSSSSSSKSPVDSPLSRSSSSDSVASLAHSETSTISSYTSCSSLLDVEESLQELTVTKLALHSPPLDKQPPSPLPPPVAVIAAPAAAVAIIPPPPALESILVAQTVQRMTRTPVAPVSKGGMPFIPEDAAPKPPSLSSTHELFEMNSRTSTLLRIDGFNSYIGSILEDFEIFPQARKDFIDYWYTRFKNQEYMAVRFLTAAEYSSLLPLHIDSFSPYTLQRLFAIFKRVTHDEAKHWYSSRLRTASYKIDWKERVGQTVQDFKPKPKPRSSRSSSSSSRRTTKEAPKRISTDDAGAKDWHASMLEIGAMELSVEAGIGRFFFI